MKICVFNDSTKKFVGNVIRVPAYWDQSTEDEWHFKKRKHVEMQDILLRLHKVSTKDQERLQVFFELVILFQVKTSEETYIKEFSCGWCSLPLAKLFEPKSQTRKLIIKGGGPSSETDIKPEDIRATRTGIKKAFRMFSKTVASKLEIKTHPMNQHKLPKLFQ